MTEEHHFVRHLLKRVQEPLPVFLPYLAENEDIRKLRVLHFLSEVHPDLMADKQLIRQIIRCVDKNVVAIQNRESVQIQIIDSHISSLSGGGRPALYALTAAYRSLFRTFIMKV